MMRRWRHWRHRRRFRRQVRAWEANVREAERKWCRMGHPVTLEDWAETMARLPTVWGRGRR